MNYRIEAIELLLVEDRILKCYLPLIPCKRQLLHGLYALGCRTRDDCLSIPDETLYAAGLPAGMADLFRRFLRMYDYKGKGVRDIPEAYARPPEEIASLLQLMCLPGVKAIRAQLYYRCGLRSLVDFATADAENLRKSITTIIDRENLPFSPPQPKELRTQIAVAKVFTEYAV